MEQKIDVAQLLKGCPTGMELDCTLVEGLEFDSILDNEYLPIRCRIKHPNGGYNVFNFTKYGCWLDTTFAKCVIFPKGKTTWEGFHRPFKDGDVLAEDSCIFIIQKLGDNGTAAKTYCALHNDGTFDDGTILYFDIDSTKLATEEEKAKLFKAIKDNGYKWNAETKTLEELPKFKDGDVIANTTFVAIFHKLDKIPNGVRNDVVYYHCLYRKENGYSKFKIDFGIGYESNFRFATDDEKQILFNVIKANGYKWNEETKTLEKLAKFKVGDEIYKRNSISNSWIVYSVNSEYYGLKLPNGYEGIGVLPVSEQDDWELVSNKFDISNLKAYDKVLVRDDNNSAWINTFFGFYDTVTNKKYPFIAGCVNWAQCIPYESNEHLLNTTDDCDEFYKNW